MRTILSERGQVVIPKKIREIINIEKGDEFEIEILNDNLLLKPIRRFKAKKWQDYRGIGKGIINTYLKDKRIEKEKEDVYP